MNSFPSDRVTIIDHPLVHHQLSVMRDASTAPAQFRRAVREITLLEAYEATKHLRTRSVDVETPLATAHCQSISGVAPVIVPILRAGMGMLDAMLEVIPTALVAHLGMYRNEETHEPVEYYAKMPADIAERQVLVVDPMLATGGSLVAAVRALRARGVTDLTALVIVAAPEGVEALLAADPDVRLFACVLDEGLNDDAYIVPGLGDAGDRIYNTVGTPVESALR